MKRGNSLLFIIFFIISLIACSSLEGFQVIGEKDRVYSNILSEYYLIGEAYLENKKYDKAITYYTKALDHPDLRESAQYKIAHTYVQAEKWDDAIRAYEVLLEKDPNNTDLEKSLAYIYARKGNLAHSSGLYRKLTEKNPYDQALLENFLTVLIAGNYLEEAEIVLNRLKTNFPDNTSYEKFENNIKSAWETQEGKPTNKVETVPSETTTETDNPSPTDSPSEAQTSPTISV